MRKMTNVLTFYIVIVNKNRVITCYKYCVLLSNSLNRLFVLFLNFA